VTNNVRFLATSRLRVCAAAGKPLLARATLDWRAILMPAIAAPILIPCHAPTRCELAQAAAARPQPLSGGGAVQVGGCLRPGQGKRMRTAASHVSRLFASVSTAALLLPSTRHSPGAAYDPTEVVPAKKDHVLPVAPRVPLHPEGVWPKLLRGLAAPY
jgi:hypothetical protein